MRTYGQPSGQLFAKRWPLSNPNRNKSIMNKNKVKHHRNSDSKTGNLDHIRSTALERSATNYWGLKSQMTWIGVNTYQQFQLRKLRQWVFFGATWPLHLGTLRKLHTKHWFALSSSMQHLFSIPIMNLRNTSSVGDMLDELKWPSLQTHREQSSLTFFYKIHSGTVSLDKDKYLTRLQT